MTIRSTIMILGFSMAFAGAAVAGTPAENKALVEGFVSVGNTRDYERLGEFVSEDFVRHCQATPGLVVTNLKQFRAFMEADAQVCPDSRVEVQQMVAEDDRVAVWATYSGTQEGAMGPFPPSGKRMDLEFGAIFRVEDNKLAELWVTWDNLAALSQLGHFPPQGTPDMPQSARKHQDMEVSEPVHYARVYTDSEGETHFSDERLSFQLVDYAPPAPLISVSEIFTAENVGFISSPAEWHGDWHPAPRRQFILVLVGELEVEVSDGEVRRFGPGSLCLVEDTSGKGHVSRVAGRERALAAAIPLADVVSGS